MSGAEDAISQDAVGQKSSGELILMGTGTSIGVPVVGCDCHVCTSDNPRNQRTRSGVLVRVKSGEFVIDTGPELRLQLLRNKASFIKAAIFTHSHADHVMGLDDLRIFGFRLEKQLLDAARAAEGDAFDEDQFRSEGHGQIPLFCEETVEADIRHTFHYAFQDPAALAHRFAAPKLGFQRITPGKEFEVLGQKVLPIRLHHGKLPILGFRINNVAFCTDVSTIPAESRSLLEGLDVLIIDALRNSPHPTHLSVDQAVKWVNKLKPTNAVLTHMAHDLDYDELRQTLPSHIEPGYDGLRIPL